MATSSKNLSTATQRVADVLLAKCDELENLLPTTSVRGPSDIVIRCGLAFDQTLCVFSSGIEEGFVFFWVPSFKAGLSASNLLTGFGLKFEGVGFRPLEF